MNAARIATLVLLVACGPAVDDAAADAETNDTTETSSQPSSSGDTPGTSPGPTSADADSGTTGEGTGAPGSGGYEDDSGGTGCAFTCPQPPTTGGGGGSLQCDIVAQDCPDGEKCMAWANDGGPQWNATRCSPLDAEPAGADEPCTVEGSGVSGIDNCAMGSMCFEVDPKTNTGVCRTFCVAPAEPCGGEQGCFTFVPGLVELCIQGCDPLASDCGAEICAPALEGFVCRPGGTQAAGDPCSTPEDCASGSLCISGDLVPACDAVGCCAAVCNVEEPDACDVELSCVTWNVDAAPPWDHVGVCISD